MQTREHVLFECAGLRAERERLLSAVSQCHECLQAVQADDSIAVLRGGVADPAVIRNATVLLCGLPHTPEEESGKNATKVGCLIFGAVARLVESASDLTRHAVAAKGGLVERFAERQLLRRLTGQWRQMVVRAGPGRHLVLRQLGLELGEAGGHRGVGHAAVGLGLDLSLIHI